MKSKSRFVIQTTEKTFCPKCNGPLDLLCHEWAGPQRERAFYICWNCKLVHEVGKGEVRRD